MKPLKNLKSLIIIIVCLAVTTININPLDSTSIFWKVTGNGLENPSYLFGTIHMIAQPDFFLPDGLEDIFKSCKQIVLEIDMDAPDFITKVQRMMFMSDSNIKELLDEDEYEILEKFFKDSLNLPLEQFQKIKPIFLTQFIVPKIINKPIASYELTFLQMAQKYKIELTGLESIEEQMNSLDKIPCSKQAELVLETVNELNENRLIYSQLVYSYKKMDFENFYKLMFKVSKELEEFEQLLLIDRNIKWVPRIESKIKDQSCFIAVGALHLEGENGLVTLLKLKGYSVIPIRNKIH